MSRARSSRGMTVKIPDAIFKRTKLAGFAVVITWILCIPPRLPAESVTIVRNNGSSANRVDLVVLGDGYTAAEMTKYAGDVENFVLSLFDQEPFREYANYFNVLRVDVVSNESGADKPASGIYRDTAFDATYYCAQMQRLICVNTSKVYDVLNRSGLGADQKDMILVLVNDSEYGGSGGAIAVASTDASCIELILHEEGHAFGLLTDEYEYSPPACNSAVEPSAANATKETDRAKIKWNKAGGPPTGWIELGTPLPTTGTASGVPGLYVGAQYCPTGLYRPTYNSKMRSLGPPFEQINNEQIIKRIYNWVSGLDSWTPDQANVTLPLGEKKTFQITTPRPRSHSLDIIWTLDGITVGTGSQIVIESSGGGYGSCQLKVDVHDPTSMVRSDPSSALNDARAWTVTGYFSFFQKIIYPPLNAMARKILVRSLTQAQYINVISFEANPGNADIVGYKICLIDGQQKTAVASLDAKTFKYWHRGVDKTREYTYSIVALNSEGREGDAAIVVVR